MGELSRKPTDNDLPVVSSDNPWGPEDEVAGLLQGTAVRCCTCERVVDQEFVTIRNGHAFCPDHERGALWCRRQDDHSHHFNVEQYIEKHTPDRCRGGSDDASDAD